MTRLIEALEALRLDADSALSGRWITLEGERCRVYVVEADWHSGFYTWCDHPEEREVLFFLDPREAIQAGLRRARQVPAVRDA